MLSPAWPPGLDPVTVPFKGRTVTALRRQGFYDDWTLFNDLTEATVLSWWNAGPVTVDDLRTTGNTAIKRHHDEAGLLRDLKTDLEAVASEPWASHIWYHDPRFATFIPKGDATVYDIATSGGAVDCRLLWEQLTGLRAAVDAQAALSPDEAIAQFVEVVSGQHGDRLEVLLVRTGLNGQDPITGSEAGRRLGVSYQRIHQMESQLYRAWDRACPPKGIWMPQLGIDETVKTEWRAPDSSLGRHSAM